MSFNRKSRMLFPVYLFVIAVQLPATVRTIQLDKDGGYTDIVIRIANSVPEDSCPKILANIKKLFNEGSHVLYEATEHRVFFKSATVVIPSSWRDGKCQTVIREPNGDTPYRGADIRIDSNKHPIYGEAPYTQQSRGCGQPGDVTVFPHKFITAWNDTWRQWGDPAKLLVHEWAKLRYGVFEERGYPGDPLFPHYFNQPDGTILPTGSSNEKVNGRWMNQDRSKECDPRTVAEEQTCLFFPAGNNGHIQCSLGYLYFLPSVKSFCNLLTSAKMPMAPSKHNIICDGRTSGEVIESHEDFANRLSHPLEGATNKKRTVQEELPKLEPDITVVRDPTEKYVIILETSASMDDHGQWKWINKAAQKFIRYDLPLNSHMSIVTFSNTSRVEHPMAQIYSDDIRSRLADTIPDKYHLSRSDVKCLLCGVQKAIHEVLRNNMAGAHLVFITRGSPDTLSISDEQTIQEYIRYYHIRVSSIVVPENDKLPLAFYDSVAQLSGGTSRIISREYSDAQASVRVYVDLMNAFTLLLPNSGLFTPPVIVHENLIEMNGYSSSTGQFIVDETLGRDTRFGIYVDDEEDHLIRSVTFTDTKGFLYGPYTSMSSLYDIINLKTVNFPVGEAPPFDDPELLGSQWQYFIEWYEGGRSRQKSAVRISSRPRYGDDDITVKIWTNTDGSSDLVTGQKPLAVYAQIIKGSSPVLRSDVSLEMVVTLGNGTEVVAATKLYDNGNGDADLVAGDGIYSRYLTKYHGAGRYAFSVRINDGEQAAFTIRATRESDVTAGTEPNLSTCCGSRVVVEKEDRIPTGKFSRSHTGPVVHLLSVPATSTDQMPPARITDLKLDVLTDGSQVLATWTAPGDDFDVGNVSGYRLLVSDNISSLIDPQASKQTLVAFNQPDMAGKQTSYQFSVVAAVETNAAYFNKDIFVAIVAFDEENNEGKVSNFVTLHLDANSYPEIPRNHPVSAQPEDEVREGVMIGALCGSIAAIALCLWAGIWYFRSQRVSTKSGGVTANLVLGGGGLGGDVESSNAMTTDDDENDNHTSKHRVSVAHSTTSASSPQFTTIAPILRNLAEDDDGTTPIYWSASQLLAHRDSMSNNSPDPNFPFPSQLDPIREEFTDEVDDDVYAQGLANYGYHMSHQMNVVTSTPMRLRGRSEDNILMSDSLLANTSSRLYSQQSVHEPVYTGYSPDMSIYGSSTISRTKIPPRVPPKPSLNALLGIGSTNDIVQPIYSTSNSQIIDIYGTQPKRNITHV